MENCRDNVIGSLLTLKENVKTEDIYGLGKNIVSRLNENEVYYVGELGFKIKKIFDIINKEDKVDIKDVINYYKSFDNVILSPDEEFADYIDSNPKFIRKVLKK